jgi:ATP-dependent Clp protease ATP-binding subunit ClpC
MADRGLQLELTDEAKDLLVDKGWDPAMGARPLRRAIQRYIEDPLADFVLRAELTPGATIMVEKAPDEDDREVSLTVVEPTKVPAAVGGGAAEASAAGDDSPAEPGGALDQPTVEEPPTKT